MRARITMNRMKSDTPTPRALPPVDMREVAAKAYCDPRTVAKYLDGCEMRSTAQRRIENALRDLGFTGLVRGAVSEIRTA